MEADYYVYTILFSFCLIWTLRSLVHQDWERASTYALCTIWLLLALYISTLWNA